MSEFIYNKHDEIFGPLQEAAEEADRLFEMANLRQVETGLPMIIWADVDRKGSHNQPRLKVSTSHATRVGDDELVSVSIEDSPKILQKNKQDVLSSADMQALSEYIRLNKAALLGYWNGEIGTLELHRHLKKVG
jgi:hypothetical protein